MDLPHQKPNSKEGRTKKDGESAEPPQNRFLCTSRVSLKIGYFRELIEIDGLSSFSPVNDGKVGVMDHGCNLCVSHLL